MTMSGSEKGVVSLLSEAAAELDDFLYKTPESTIFHTLEWHRIIQKTYGHKFEYWVVRVDQEIVGIFPVNIVQFPMLRPKMVAMPYQFHSGLPLALSEELQVNLVEYALNHARIHGPAFGATS